LDEVTEGDLRALVRDGVPEGRSIEYKLELTVSSDEDRKEFLADVSSFANAGGGNIVFGVDESGGVAVGVPGLDCDLDAEILRLENLVRDGVAPRIPGLRSRAVRLASGKGVIMMRVPRSLARPHVVDFKNRWRFYGRASNGKHPMDVDEVRAAFVGSEAVADRARAFRAERLALIASGDAPTPLPQGAPRAVLHVLPLSAFDSPEEAAVDLEGGMRSGLLLPPGNGGFPRYNFDGVVSEGRSGEGFDSYAQLFRAGGVEGVTTEPFLSAGGQKRFGGERLEGFVIEALQQYLTLQRRLGVEPPVAVMLSLVSVRGYVIPGGSIRRVRPVDRDDLVVPEALVREDLGLDREGVERLLRPAFDAIWNACGYAGSLSFGPDGRWTGGYR
jgi:hypothetical protein